MIKNGDFKVERIREDGVKVNVPPAPGPKYDRGPAVEMPVKAEEEKQPEKQKQNRNHRRGKNRDKHTGEENFKVVEQQSLKEEKVQSEQSVKKEEITPVSPELQPEIKSEPVSSNTPKKGGWWNRLMGE